MYSTLYENKEMKWIKKQKPKMTTWWVLLHRAASGKIEQSHNEDKKHCVDYKTSPFFKESPTLDAILFNRHLSEYYYDGSQKI